MHARYQKFHRPGWRVLIAALTVFAGLLVFTLPPVLVLGAIGSPLIMPGIREYLSLYYVALYVGMWLLYFLSPIGRELNPDRHPVLSLLLRVQTLRNLLNLASRQRQAKTAFDVDKSEDDPYWDTVNEKYQDKARTGMAAVAILVATSVVLIRQCLDTLAVVTASDTVSLFDAAAITAAFTGAFLSLLYFVAAIDDLDTVFNDFATKFENCLLDFYFFRRSANPRFIGLAILVFAVNLLVLAENRLLGCLTLTISFYIFYGHIFPLIVEEKVKTKSLIKPGSDFRWQRLAVVVIPALLVGAWELVAALSEH